MRHIDDVTSESVTLETERIEPQMEGGGGSGRGPSDDDGRRRPERPDGNGATRLLIALGIIALGAGVMSARLLAKGGRFPRAS